MPFLEGSERCCRCICIPRWVRLSGVLPGDLVRGSFSSGEVFLCLFFRLSFWLGLAYHLQQFPPPRD